MQKEHLIRYHPSGETEGIDPRTISINVLEESGHVKTPILDVIRAKCLDCSHTQSEASKCVAITCPLWPYRMATNPFFRGRELTEEQRKVLSDRLALSRANKE